MHLHLSSFMIFVSLSFFVISLVPPLWFHLPLFAMSCPSLFVMSSLSCVIPSLFGHCDDISFGLSLCKVISALLWCHLSSSFCDLISLCSAVGEVPARGPGSDGRGLPSMHQAAELHTLPGLPAPCGWGERSEVTVFSRYKLMLKVNVLLRNNQLSISDLQPLSTQ